MKYRTSGGKEVDLGELILRNEKVTAVGNMGVNAVGEKLDVKATPSSKRNKSKSRKKIQNKVTDAPLDSTITNVAKKKTYIKKETTNVSNNTKKTHSKKPNSDK